MTRHLFSLAIALMLAEPALAQDLNSASGSAANANSGSVSGASSNGNQQAQGQTQNNAGIGSSTSTSGSASGAVSGSESHSGSISDQTQGQALDSRNTNSTAVGQQATNQQGVSVSNTFNSTNWKRSYVSTNTAVPLAASSSFSSDFCGSTVSGGASAAPIGISIGGSAPTFDNSCRYLRLAEKAGMLGANYYNMQQPEMALKALSLQTWATCMAGPHQDKRRGDSYEDNYVMQACLSLGLLGSQASPVTPPPVPQPPVTPPEATRAAQPAPDYSDLPPKTPRGDAGSTSTMNFPG